MAVEQVDLLAKGVSPLCEKEFEFREAEHLKKVTFTEEDEQYLSHYLLHKDRKCRVKRESQSGAADAVKSCMDLIQTKLQDTDFRGGTMIETGSFYENTKVGDPNEFDYLYKRREAYTATLATVPKTKTKTSNLDSKVFYKLHRPDGQEIVAMEMHQAFQSTLKQILTDIFGVKDTENGVMLKKAGPAVKFVLILQDSKGKTKDVKIDVTYALDVDGEERFLGGVELRSYAKYLYERGKLTCHFIAAHDYWKLSFTRTEKEIMARVSAVNYKGVCYRAMKIVRDSVDVKDTLGDGILSSYPIKITHMKKTLASPDAEIHRNTWTRENVGRNVIEIARAVNRDGEKQRMLGIFLKNDHILADADKSYLESRRIIDELKNITSSFQQYATVNTIIWLLLIVCSLGMMIALSVALANTDWRLFHDACSQNSSFTPFPLNLPFIFAYTVLSWVSFFANLAGVIQIFLATYIWRKELVAVLPNIKYIYVITTTSSLALIVLDIFLLYDFINDHGCTHLGTKSNIIIVTGVSLFLALLPEILLLISVLSYLVYYRCSCRNWSRYDVLFFQFPYCRDRKERLEDEATNSPLSQEEFTRLGSLLKSTVTRVQPVEGYGHDTESDSNN